MAECTDYATFVCGSTVQESEMQICDDEMCPKPSNETMNDTVFQMSDDESAESVVTIGEIGIDEYFDETFCSKTISTNPVIHDTQSNSEPSTSGPSTSNAPTDAHDESINVLQLAVDSVHPDIPEKVERISFEELRFNQDMEFAAMINHYIRSGKRVRKTKIEEDGSRTYYYPGLSLDNIGVKTLPRFLSINTIDENIMSTNRLLLRLPAPISVLSVLQSFVEKKNVEPISVKIMLEAFNTILPLWCLRQIEQLQYETLIEKYPNKKLNEIYGVVHFVRFTTFLPYMIRAMGPFGSKYNDTLVNFMINFMDFLEETDIIINQDDFHHVMPDYHRMTFKSGPSKYLYKREKLEDEEDDDDDEY